MRLWILDLANFTFYLFIEVNLYFLKFEFLFWFLGLEVEQMR